MGERVGERRCRRCDSSSCTCARRDPSASSRTSGHERPTAGRPIDRATRSRLEPLFRFDFSAVRIFDDRDAHDRAEALGAAAFTAGSDIGFAAGQHAPGTPAGRWLLAHELAHVVQQSAVSPATASASGDAAEVEADAAAAAASAGRAVPPLSARPAGAPQLKRHPVKRPSRIAPVAFRSEPTDVVADLHPAGSLDEAQWQAALQRGDYATLYADTARVAQAERVIDTSTITTVVDAHHGGVAPGLNLATAKDAQHPGETGFVDAAGNFGVMATLEAGKPQVAVAIVLHPDAFTSKADAVMTLRHELEHAEHLQTALDLIEKWRAGGGGGRAASRARRGRAAAPAGAVAEAAFEGWLDKRRGVSEVERVLTKEAARGTRANTEVLGPVEGFMSAFHLIDPASTSMQRAFAELLGAAGDEHEGKWQFADPSVRAQALGRLREYYCHTLDRAHRDLFAGWVDAQIRENNGTRFGLGEALGAGDEIPDAALQTIPATPTSDEAKKRREAQRMAADAKADFLKGLKEIVDDNCASIGVPMKL